ncbi:MAG: hypothetical protein A3K04_10050 [Gallionellales bacterium RBG_16_56_9]|jgi:hypothetical protein|nr:MAG: hypothetical protein A3K04_10050 [Gallionellales bacterium RBG_16_56_9]
MNTHQKSDTSLTDNALRVAWHVSVWVFVIVMVALAWFVATERPYKAGDAIGYNLGLVGGSMMLMLLIYSLRKRLGFMNKAGPVRHYFAFHMFLGVVGPILVIFHTTFKIGALNSRIALYSMLLVAGSGLVGRFVYRHIHQGLYGRQTSLAEAEQLLNESAESVQSILSISPDIEKKLEDFRAYSVVKLKGVLARSWRFMTLRMRGHSLAHAVRKEAWHALVQAGREKNWPHDELAAQQKLAGERINGYVEAVCSAATYATWVRLFALWHVVHVPFLYLLILTGIVHVIAVNFMY